VDERGGDGRQDAGARREIEVDRLDVEPALVARALRQPRVDLLEAVVEVATLPSS